MHNLQRRPIANINLNDPFFDSLRADYQGFNEWFNKKAYQGEYALVFINPQNNLDAFLYTKIEQGAITDVVPELPHRRYLKVGTMKVNAHGTKLGEYFIKQIFDQARLHAVQAIYVTVFPKHEALCGLFERYGFKPYAQKGDERVYVRRLINNHGDVVKDFPVVRVAGRKIVMLAIYPKFHTRLFAESILNSERADMLQDVSHTNSIHKVYVGWTDRLKEAKLQAGDIVVIYRTSDNLGPARFRSVATSVCVIEEVRHRDQFADASDFIDFCGGYSVFTEAELYSSWEKYKMVAIKMLYNIALNKRITNGQLIDEVGLNDKDHWGLRELTEQQLRHILAIGEADESIVIY